MAKTMRWSCDGCDTAVDGENNNLPTNWQSVSIHVNNLFGLAGVPESYDLCPQCQTSLQQICNPKQWARTIDISDEMKAYNEAGEGWRSAGLPHQEGG